MKKRCQKISCKKVATSLYNGKYVCKEHRCRCHIELSIYSLFNGCKVHQRGKKKWSVNVGVLNMKNVEMMSLYV